MHSLPYCNCRRGVDVNPAATLDATRVCGNGGMFGITGAFSNQVIGRYRAFVTDPERAVVLEFSPSKLVVTRDEAHKFEAAVLEALAGSKSESSITAAKP